LNRASLGPVSLFVLAAKLRVKLVDFDENAGCSQLPLPT